MKLTGPDVVPPEETSSSLYHSRIDSIESSTARMKHALTCCFDGVPTLNLTGELKLNTWCSSIQVNSWPKISASSGVAK